MFKYMLQFHFTVVFFLSSFLAQLSKFSENMHISPVPSAMCPTTRTVAEKHYQSRRIGCWCAVGWHWHCVLLIAVTWPRSRGGRRIFKYKLPNQAKNLLPRLMTVFDIA